MEKQNSPESATCMDEFDPSSMLMQDALDRICSSVQTVANSENISIRHGLNRVLAEPIKSTINVPPYTNSAMDGYAINGSDIPNKGEMTLKIVGTVMAGTPLAIRINRGECARIMTGGKIPEGSDTVIMQEHVRIEKDCIVINANHQTGQNVRRSGEDIAINQSVLDPGKRLGAADLGLIASLGVEFISVRKAIKVAFFSTGDELTSVGTPLEEGQIYDSNRYTLSALLHQFGADIIDLGVVRDNQSNVEAAFLQAAKSADVLITTGGVSVGEADFVKDTLAKLGTVNFWKIAMKPGKPLAFGEFKNCVFFGLPGNPVSTMVTYYQFVLTALKILQGEVITKPIIFQARCISKLHKTPGRIEFQRGLLKNTENGELVVQSVGGQGSHILSSMSKANCLIILPLESDGALENTMVNVQLFSGFM